MPDTMKLREITILFNTEDDDSLAEEFLIDVGNYCNNNTPEGVTGLAYSLQTWDLEEIDENDDSIFNY